MKEKSERGRERGDTEMEGSEKNRTGARVETEREREREREFRERSGREREREKIGHRFRTLVLVAYFTEAHRFGIA